jgi:Tfp pilus assembly protein PilX
VVTRRTVHPVRKIRQRARERGATLFVVLLVITLLMGIGTFAARSAAVATNASGSERQMTQARYVAEYGLTYAAAKLSNGGAQSYLQRIRTPPSTEICYGQTTTMAQRTCYRMLYADAQNDLNAGGYNMCEPAVVSTSAAGSLGGLRSVNGTTTWAECDFSVELADLSEGFTLPGFDLGHGKALKFWYVNASAIGQARIVNTGVGTLDAVAGESSGTQQVRSRILLGPFPTN